MSKLHLRQLFLITFVLTLVGGTTCGAEAADVHAILEAAKVAAGGSAWNRVKSIRIVESSSTGGAETTRTELDDLNAGRYVVHASTEGLARAGGYDGITYWVQDRTGFAFPEGDEDARTTAATESYRVQRAWWFRDRHPSSIEDGGPRQEGERRFDTIAITPLGGRPFTVWIDQRTHLVDRFVEQGSEELVTTRLSDYRPVAGVMVPYSVTEDDDDAKFTVSEVTINPSFVESDFSLPRVAPEEDGTPVTVPIRFQRGDVLVPIMLNGRGPFDCEFDSGGGLVIPPSLVAKLGLRRRGTEKAYGGGEGSVTSGRGILASISIGALQLKDQEFSILDLDNEHPERFLTGEGLLHRFVIQLDFDKMTMTLTPFAQFQYRGAGEPLPFRFQDNDPEILGSIDGVAATMAIDTGDNGSLLLIGPFARKYDFANRYHAKLSYAGTAVAATRGLYARGGEVAFDGLDGRSVFRVHGPITRISQQTSGFDANRYTSANIGMGILRQFNITFDYHRKLIYFEPNHFFGQPDVFDRSGLVLKRETDHWTIARVYPDSPAAKAGLAVGDVLELIDGKPIAALSSDDTSALFRGPVGSAVEVNVGSSNGDRKVVLHLREIL